MSDTIIFHYGSGNAKCCSVHGTGKQAIEDSIKYWLDKSPGVHQIEKIMVITESADNDWTWVISKKIKEERDAADRYREVAERSEFERLKAKYEQTRTID